MDKMDVLRKGLKVVGGLLASASVELVMQSVLSTVVHGSKTSLQLCSCRNWRCTTRAKESRNKAKKSNQED